MNYENFKVAVFFTNNALLGANDLSIIDKIFVNNIEKYIKVSKVYLETYRKNKMVDKDILLHVKQYFKRKGINTSGAITTDVKPDESGIHGEWRFRAFCYSNPEHIKKLERVISYTAELFDEIILDDFYFFNCKCEFCINAKGEKTWTEFRLAAKEKVTKEILIKSAKKVNPDVKLIIKYPNWYDDYQSSGYNLEKESESIDLIYTGTETRNPRYTQQNLQRYSSYFLMRYLENVKPGNNLGGWIDTFDSRYSLNAYAEQAYLTLFAKAREITLFAFLIIAFRDRLFNPVSGFVFERADTFLNELGNPIGISCYKPYHSNGENYIHGFLGMLGISLEPTPHPPEKANTILLTESAKKDPGILDFIKRRLIDGSRVIVTSGLVKALENEGFGDIAEIRCTGNKAVINEFAYFPYECGYKHLEYSKKDIIIPDVQFSEVDCRQIIAGISENNIFPILLETRYANGFLYVLTIPDNYGDLYNFPAPVVNYIRRIFLQDFNITIEAPANIGLFLYDNNTFIIESFLPYKQDIKIIVYKGGVVLTDIENIMDVFGSHYIKQIQSDTDENSIFEINLLASSFRVFKITQRWLRPTTQFVEKQNST